MQIRKGIGAYQQHHLEAMSSDELRTVVTMAREQLPDVAEGSPAAEYYDLVGNAALELLAERGEREPEWGE